MNRNHLSAVRMLPEHEVFLAHEGVTRHPKLQLQVDIGDERFASHDAERIGAVCKLIPKEIAEHGSFWAVASLSEPGGLDNSGCGNGAEVARAEERVPNIKDRASQSEEANATITADFGKLRGLGQVDRAN